jgi:hypothetical protein
MLVLLRITTVFLVAIGNTFLGLLFALQEGRLTACPAV